MYTAREYLIMENNKIIKTMINPITNQKNEISGKIYLKLIIRCTPIIYIKGNIQ